MLQIGTELRLDLAIAIRQVSLIAQKFGRDMSDIVHEGIVQQLLTGVIFYFIHRTEPKLHEIHGIVYVDILYKEGSGPEFSVRWEPKDGKSDMDVEPTLCQDFNAVIDHVLHLAKSASGCYWGTQIRTTPTAEGIVFRKRHGYDKCNEGGICYVDRTKPISQPMQNSQTDTVQMRVCASDRFMNGELS